MNVHLDGDAVKACADLVVRTGATGFEIGYLHDDVPVDEAGWYAHAQYKGARITTDGGHRGPVEAAEALARRLLTGAKCKCGKLAALDTSGAVAYRQTTLADGSSWSAQQAAAAGQCHWTRHGARWISGCDNASSDKAMEHYKPLEGEE